MKIEISDLAKEVMENLGDGFLFEIDAVGEKLLSISIFEKRMHEDRVVYQSIEELEIGEK